MHANRRAPCQVIGAVFADYGPAYDVCRKANRFPASNYATTVVRSTSAVASRPDTLYAVIKSIRSIRCAKFFSPRPDLHKNRLNPPAKPVYQRKLRFRLIYVVAYFTCRIKVLPSPICVWKVALSKEPFLLTYRFSPKADQP